MVTHNHDNIDVVGKIFEWCHPHVASVDMVM